MMRKMMIQVMPVEEEDDVRRCGNLVAEGVWMEDSCTRIETLTRHFPIIDGVAQYFGQVEEDSTPLVEDLDARLDLEVFAHGNVQRM